MWALDKPFASRVTMQLDVVVPTYNRQDMLKRTLNSLLAAEIPAGMEVRVTIVDNNSKDNTRFVVEEYLRRSNGRLSYIFEGRQGRSSALNAGIASTTGELVGMIDDDEEIDSAWYATVFSAFNRKTVDFIGGPYVPKWGAPAPEWLPPNYGSVVGWVDGGDREVAFDRNYPGILMGGNAVFKRSVLEMVGPYSTWLGRTDKRLLSCEDEEMYDRLMASGAKGRYLPHLIVYHHIPPERLTKGYFRRWCFWRGVSLGLLERTRRQSCAYLLGIPRWQYRQAGRGMLTAAAGLFVRPKDSAKAFASELAIWDCIGLFYGKHFYRSPVQE
jgi:glucosyl-dolichyl phosphate glucuronosyltransferase